MRETLLDRMPRRPACGGDRQDPDLFAGRGISDSHPTKSDAEGIDRVSADGDAAHGLIFANLVDFDTVYGHRNDVAGYAANLERFDARLPRLLASSEPTTCSWSPPITERSDDAEHRSFARTRPPAAARTRVNAGVDLGTRATFADLGQTLADNFGVGPLPHGTASSRHNGRRKPSIREELEQRERETLAPQAAKSAASRGACAGRGRPSARRSSAIATGSSTARRSDG